MKRLFDNEPEPYILTRNDMDVESWYPVKVPKRGTQKTKWEKTPPRNEPCPCGSGDKYKKCCGRP
jgi:uncharacterized protein YecA (UPF0149 family)